MGTKQLTWIGNISYAQPQGRGEYPGAMMMKFRSYKKFNDYFAPGNSGERHMCIDKTEVPVLFGLLGVHIYAMITNQLNEEELADMMEVQRETEFAMAKRRQERKEAKEKLEAEQKANAQDRERLILVGEKYEARVKHMKSLAPGDTERKELEKLLNAGDPEVLFNDKKEAYQSGYVQAMNYIRELNEKESKNG